MIRSLQCVLTTLNTSISMISRSSHLTGWPKSDASLRTVSLLIHLYLDMTSNHSTHRESTIILVLLAKKPPKFEPAGYS